MAEARMPDAKEWAKRFVTSCYSLGVDEVTPILLEFRREVLLAAAEYVSEQGLCYIAEKLERMAH